MNLNLIRKLGQTYEEYTTIKDIIHDVLLLHKELGLSEVMNKVNMDQIVKQITESNTKESTMLKYGIMQDFREEFKNDSYYLFMMSCFHKVIYGSYKDI